MFINNIPLHLKVILQCLLQRSVTRQDDVHSDVTTQVIQAVEHPYLIFQSLNVVSNDFSPFRETFQESNCVSGVMLNHVKNIQVAQYTHCRGYHFSFAIKQHYEDKKMIMLCTAVEKMHNFNNNHKFVCLVYEYYQNI